MASEPGQGFLSVETQPSGAVNDVAFTTQPKVLVGSGGNTAPNGTVVTVAIASGSGTLTKEGGGPLTATTTSGVATFSGLKIVGTGDFTLVFSATLSAGPGSVDVSATSASFTVVAASNEDDMLTFSIGARNGAVGTVPVGGLYEIAVTVPFGTDVANLVASFTVSPGAVTTIRGAGADFTTPTSGVTVTDFTDPVTYRVTAEDRVAFKSYKVTVTIAAAINPSSGGGGGSSIARTTVSALEPELVFSGKKWTITKNNAGVSTIGVNLARSQAGKTALIYKRTKKGKLILLGEQRLGKNGRTVLQTEKPLRPGQKLRVQVDGKFRSTVTIP